MSEQVTRDSATGDLEAIAVRAMAIILPCGEARTRTREAIDLAHTGDELGALALLDLARERLRDAHRAQTGIVQGEARGEAQAYSVLFTHAQDILMTAMSEEALARQLVGYAAAVERRLGALEQHVGPITDVTDGESLQ